MTIQLEAITNFGMEAVTKRELEQLNVKNINVANGLLTFSGKVEDIGRANLWLRTAERVHLVLKKFPATTFDMLYEGVKEIPWAEIMPVDANFITEAKSQKSKLFSLSDIQRLTEKAIVDKLNDHYHQGWFEKTGARFTVGTRIIDDEATIYLDTSGEGLHSRGYRQRSVKAPLTETLAAGLVLLSYWNKDRSLVDPFCGSGTIPIEAAMIGKNIAPGLERSFDFESWPMESKIPMKELKREAFSKMDFDTTLDILASDVNPKAIESARYNVEALGLEEDIQLMVKDIKNLNLGSDYGVLITNPPYGERIENASSVRELNRELGKLAAHLDTWSIYVITSRDDFERDFGKRADRKRKLYNGRIKVDYYQYYGPKPPRK